MRTGGSTGSPWAVLVAWSAQHSRLVVFAWCAFGVACASSLLGLRIDTSTESFIRRDTLEWQRYRESTELYGSDEFLTVAIIGAEPFSRDALRRVRALSGELEAIPEVRRVDSLATVPLIRRGAEGDLRLDAALASGVPESSADLRSLATDLRRDLLAPGLLFSSSGRDFALNVHFDQSVEEEPARLVDQVEGVASRYGAIVSGVPAFRSAVNRVLRSELATFVPIVAVLLIAVLFGVFGDVRPALLALSPGVTGSLASLGAMAATDTTLALSTMILPCVLVALGCAYSMHPLAAAASVAGPGRVVAMQAVSRAVGLSGVTTALGFAAIGTVRLGMIQDLARFGTLGVLAVTLATLTLVPAIAAGWVPRDRSSRRVQRVADFGGWLGRVVSGRPGWVVLFWLATLVPASIGVSRIAVSTNVAEWFGRGAPIRDNYETIRKELSGITPVNVVIESRDDQPVTRRDALAAMARMKVFLEEQDSVGRAVSVTDPLRQLGRELNGIETVPASPDVAEQYLLMLEGVEQLEQLITPDRLGANIMVQMRGNESTEIAGVGRVADRWWSEHGPEDYRADFTGVMYQVARSADEITTGLVRGFALALLAVGGVLLAVLRNPRHAFVALVPNVVPLCLIFGAMGFLDIPLDAATVVLGSLALGIAVDDTMHVMLGVREADGPAAVEGTLRAVLPALAISSLAVGAGFIVLGASSFVLVGNLGVLTTGFVVLCLVADVTLLPALISWRP